MLKFDNYTLSELEAAVEAKKAQIFNSVRLEFQKGFKGDTLTLSMPLISSKIWGMSNEEVKDMIRVENLQKITFFYDNIVVI